METLEEKFIALWNAGVKYSDIEEQLNIDSSKMGYLRKTLNVTPRRDDEAQRNLRKDVWEMVLRRIPVETIVEEKSVTSTYVRQTINKKGYSIRDFYDKPIRKKRVVEHKELPQPKDGVRCTESVMQKCIYGTYDCCMYCVIERHRRPCDPEDCTCFKRRPKGFKQKSWSFVK